MSVEWRDGPPALGAGDHLLLSALAANLAPPRNPGEFDRAGFLRRSGVRSELTLRGLADGRVVRPGGRWQPLTLARGVHDWMQGVLCLDLRDDPDICAIVSTALLGLRDRPGLGELAPVFQRTGTLHYFAIDGLKLGLVAFLLLRVLAAAGLSRAWAGLGVLPLLLGYALATGLGAASARAVVVAAVLVGGEWIDRPTQPLNSLGAAAAGLLLFDTNQLFELGFQLSFAVVLAILTLAEPIGTRLRGWIGPEAREPDDDPLPWPRRLWDLFRREACVLTAVAIAAWLGSMPLMWLDFHLVSPVSPLANVVAFPLAFAVLTLGVCSLGGAAFSRTWVTYMNNANWLAAKALLATVRAFDTVPGGSFALASPEHWRGWVRPPALEIVALDLGRARAAFLHAHAADWLLDCGRPLDYFTRVRPCLQARGVQRLGGLLITQDDADHLGAVVECEEDFVPARIVLPATTPRSSAARALRKDLAARAVPVEFAQRGDGPAPDAHVFYPPADSGARGTAADRALALRLDAAGWRIWWIADGDGAATRWLLANESPGALRGDVLVTAPPVSAAWCKAVGARLVVLRPPVSRRERPGDEATLPAGATMSQEASGAVTLDVYSDRVEARGFVDGREIVLRK